MPTELQKAAAQAIVNIFETGRIIGEYGRVTLLAGDSGRLTYGRTQTTLASGGLYELLKSYCDKKGARHASVFRPYLSRLAVKDIRLDQDMGFRNLLKQAGDDPVMQQAQDVFFDEKYWQPACRSAAELGFSLPLSIAVLYDSLVHGSWSAMRDRTSLKSGQPRKLGEQKWITAYVDTRRQWLATHSNSLLRRTVYRMDSFSQLIRANKWTLALPLNVRGRRIDTASLRMASHQAVDVPAPSAERVTPDNAARELRLMAPPLQGEDVRALQLALSREGYAMNRDGVFDAGLEQALKSFQEENGLVANGVAGPATRIILGI